MDIDKIGKEIDIIPVEISYRIIELFSAGLYSSPNKAFEELVSNSYDAGATKVCVYVPLDKTLESSILWVCDNGQSMDGAGLKQFWKIGSSNKRLNENPNRPPIGKFGIGKLATYILTHKLSLICKSISGYFAVTMNFASISTTEQSEIIKLSERQLTLEEAKIILSPIIVKNDQSMLSFDLWGDSAEPTWTFAILSDLKPKAQQIKDGKLKWILSTALPLNPNFNLYFNGVKIKSSKENLKVLKSFVFGLNDETASKFGYETSKHNDIPCIHLPSLMNVVGKIDLFEDSLVKGKSEEFARSHGIFLTVRGRLINIDDALLPGMIAMSHGVFNRVRIEVNADGLDEYITSTREAIIESEPLSQLKKYIERKFEEVKKEYFNRLEEEERKNKATFKIAYASTSLSRRPLVTSIKKLFDGDISGLYLVESPENLSNNEKEKILNELNLEISSEKGIIQNVEWTALNPEDPIAKFHLLDRTARINLMHPFFANLIDEVKSHLPFQLIAITEILTEAFLIESGVSEEIVRSTMHKRDNLLRELTFSDKPNATLVAQILQASLGDSTGLEQAVSDSFNTLGFESTKIGGSKKPDGLARAILGHINSTENYSVIFDAKSTSKSKIMASTAHISGVDRHRDDYKAEYSCVIAIDFEGGTDNNSAVNVEAKKHKINLIRAKDLLTLVLLSSPKQIGLKELREFFENCHTVLETSNWIGKIKEKVVNPGPIKELLETTYRLMTEDKEPPYIAVVRVNHTELKKMSLEDLKTLVQSLERLVPNFIKLSSEGVVELQTSPAIIINTINKLFTSDSIPLEFREMYLKSFGI